MTIVQRRLASLAILLPGAAIAWGLGLWFQEQREYSQKAQASASKLWHCEPAVVGVKLAQKAGAINIYRRAEPTAPLDAKESWRLEAPLSARGDDDTIDALVEAVCELRTLGAIRAKPNEPPLSLQQFGLTPPSATLTLTFADGREQTVAFGDKSAFDGSLFVQRPGNSNGAAAPTSADPSSSPNAISKQSEAKEGGEVDRVEGGFAFQIERDAFSLRDKRLLALRGQDVTEVSVALAPPAGRSPATAEARAAFVVRRSDHGFDLFDASSAANANALGEPLRADTQQARTFFDQLATLRASRFVEDHPNEIAATRFGLAHPAAVFTLKHGDQQTSTLRVGILMLGEAKHTFAQGGSTATPIAEVKAESLLETAQGGLNRLRDMHLLHAASEEVADLVIESGDSSLHLERTEASSSQGPAQWRVAKEGSATALDQNRVRGLIFRLCNLRADTLGANNAQKADLEAAKLSPPEFLVRLSDKAGNVVGTLRIGRAAAERRPAQGDDGSIGSIFAGAIDGLSSQASDYAAAPESDDGADPGLPPP